MINDHQFNQGDLYLVDFDPSTGHEYQKKRPALIIESNEQIKNNNLITVLPLTSNLDNKTADDILVKADEKNRLKSNSIIKVFCVVSFDHARFINKIGAVDDEVAKKVKNYLIKHFDLK